MYRAEALHLMTSVVLRVLQKREDVATGPNLAAWRGNFVNTSAFSCPLGINESLTLAVQGQTRCEIKLTLYIT